MHMKRVIIMTDDDHSRAWVESAIESLDVSVAHGSFEDIEGLIRTQAVDLIIADGANELLHTFDSMESAVSTGLDLRLLAIVQAGELGRLRMPGRLPADFVVRTASSSEIAARVRGLLWPGEEAAADDIIRSGDLALNLATYQASVRGEPIEFTFLEYTLFAFLITHPNRVYSRETLLHRVWNTDYFGGVRTVDVHVRRIRSKLGPESAAQLETVRNVGYLWRQ